MDLELTPEQRRCLALSEQESLRPLATGAGTVVLERVHPERERSWPRDRELVLTADVRAFSLADLLQLVHASSKSGFLAFDDGDHCKSVYLHRGEVVFAASNQRVDRLGECLLRAGVITRAQLREAREAYSPPEHYGKTLVERGFVTPRQIWNGVRLQVEEIVRSLFSYAAGTVLFFEGEVRPDNVVRLALPTRNLVAEGLRRRDELLRFLAHLEHPSIRIGHVPGAGLSGTERAVYEAARSESSFAGLCRVASLDPLSCARTVHGLRLLRALVVERTRSQAESAAPPAGEVEALGQAVERFVCLLAELAAPIVAVEGAEGLRQRFQQVVTELAARFPELLDDLEVGPGAVLDPGVLTRRVLRFPGDREAELRHALSELVSYLEFELRNHPGVRDPEGFLRDLEPARSSL